MDRLEAEVRLRRDCAPIYWRGAHSKRLEPIVESAIRAAAAARPGGR